MLFKKPNPAVLIFISYVIFSKVTNKPGFVARRAHICNPQFSGAVRDKLVASFLWVMMCAL